MRRVGDVRGALIDFVGPKRPIALSLVSGRGHYEAVIEAVLAAQTSVWIATANLKELMIEDHRARPGVRRSLGKKSYRSILAALAELSARGVELRILHAERPSRPFRAELTKQKSLAPAPGGLGQGAPERSEGEPLPGAAPRSRRQAASPGANNNGLELRVCPRVHLKAVIVDGALLYLGSANWTGAGLGARGSRNFELGVVTDDGPLLDQVQGLYERIWTGGECGACKLRELCPGPLDATPSPPSTASPAPARRPSRRR